MSSDIAGLGLAIEVSNGQCRVLHTILGGAGHNCGKISPGDILLAVLDRERSPNFLETEGLDFAEVKSLIAGRRGTKVTLKMRRHERTESGGDGMYLCEDLVRSPVQPPPQPPIRVNVDSPTLFPGMDSRRTGLQQGMEGVGIVLDFQADSEYPSVFSMLPGKSAMACGKIAIGDVLLSVNKVSTKNKSFDEIRGMIAGPVGSFVSLSFRGQSGLFDCENLLRGDMMDSSPESSKIQDSVQKCLTERMTDTPHNRHNRLGSAPTSSDTPKELSSRAPLPSFMSSDLFGAKKDGGQAVANPAAATAEEQAIQAEEDRARLQAHERARKEAEDKARLEAAEVAARRAAEERSRRDEEARRKEAELRLRAADEERARRRAAEESAGREAEAKAKRELEERSMQEKAAAELSGKAKPRGSAGSGGSRTKTEQAGSGGREGLGWFPLGLIAVGAAAATAALVVHVRSRR